MAFFVDAKPCHQAKKMAACPMHQQMDHQQKKEQKGCCDDQTELIQFDLDQFSYSFAFDADLNPDFFPAFVSAFYTDPISTDLQTVEFLNYRPPLIVLDLPVRFQTFLC